LVLEVPRFYPDNVGKGRKARRRQRLQGGYNLALGIHGGRPTSERLRRSEFGALQCLFSSLACQL
jgi:hypothetical protein